MVRKLADLNWGQIVKSEDAARPVALASRRGHDEHRYIPDVDRVDR